MSEKRRDNRNRILRSGESQRKDGRSAYKYTDTFGKVQFVYAWKLVHTDKAPAGKRDDISLREKEKEIQKDLDDGIDTIGKKMTVCELYAKQNRHLLRSAETGYYIEKPKTQSGIRQIPMSEKVYEALGRMLENRKGTKQLTIDGYSNFLFLNRDGCPKVAKNYDNMFRGLEKKYNKNHEEALPKVMTQHTLRHTFCTNLANAGMNPKALQYVMGHSNITMTLNYYAHATFASARAEMERLYYKSYKPASKKADYFAGTEFRKKNIDKFRCGQHSQVRCFGYREEDRFYILMVERDHSVSDTG